MTEEERRDIANAIWLCQNCAKLVDNDALQFPWALLVGWKGQAEKAALEEIGRVEREKSPCSSTGGWVESHRSQSRAGFDALGVPRGLEVHLCASTRGKFVQATLLDGVSRAMAAKPGYWPFGAVKPPLCTPKPRGAEIVAEIDESVAARWGTPVQHCYWALAETGEFFAAEGYLEDLNKIPEQPYLFADYRILRVVEVLRFARLLYRNLGFGSGVIIRIGISHLALRGRLLGNASRRPFIPPHEAATENQVSAVVEAEAGEIQAHMVDLVKGLTASLFGTFNFFAPFGEDYDELSRGALEFLDQQSKQW
jgi:hypothetical protein